MIITPKFTRAPFIAICPKIGLKGATNIGRPALTTGFSQNLIGGGCGGGAVMEPCVPLYQTQTSRKSSKFSLETPNLFIKNLKPMKVNSWCPLKRIEIRHVIYKKSLSEAVMNLALKEEQRNVNIGNREVRVLTEKNGRAGSR